MHDLSRYPEGEFRGFTLFEISYVVKSLQSVYVHDLSFCMARWLLMASIGVPRFFVKQPLVLYSCCSLEDILTEVRYVTSYILLSFSSFHSYTKNNDVTLEK